MPRSFLPSSIVCAMFFCAATSCTWANGFDAEAFAGYDSNVTRTQSGTGIASDTTQGIRIAADRSIWLEERSVWILKGVGNVERHARFPGLNNAALSAAAAYRIQPVVGYTSPWYEVSASLERIEYANSKLRDGTAATMSAAVGKRFTDRIYSQAAAGYERRMADHGDVFSLRDRRLQLSLGYSFAIDRTFFTRLTHIRGDQVFGAIETEGKVVASKASGADTALGENFYLYRVNGFATWIEAGVSVPVPACCMIEVVAKHIRAGAAGGLVYGDSQALINMRFRF